MKLRKLHVAVAMALGAGISGHASALSLPVNTANTLEVRVSGASAQDTGVFNMMRRICSNGTLDVYTNQTNTSASYPFVGNQALYLCTNNTNTSFGITGLGTAFSNVALYKSSVGGSGTGVQPVNNSVATAFLIGTNTATALGCSNTASPISVAATTDTSSNTVLGSARVFLNCSATQNVVPDAGFSDVEPPLFDSNPANTNNLAVNSANGVIFGIPVTLNLYRALQTAQGLTTDDDASHMPSLSKLQIAGVLNGAITSWANLETPTGGSLGLSDNTVYLARRVDTSGTQKFAGIYFLNNPCYAGSDFVISTPATTSCTAPTGTVFLGSGSSDVKNCLNALNTGGRAGLGLLSTEFPPKSTDGYRFVKVNGKAPSLVNAANALYDYVAEQTIQWRSTTNPLTGTKLTFMQGVVAKIGDPVVVSAIDGPLVLPISDGVSGTFNAGLMSLFTNGYTPNDPATSSGLTNSVVLANPVIPSSKAVSGSPQNCSTPQVIFPVSVSQ